MTDTSSLGNAGVTLPQLKPLSVTSHDPLVVPAMKKAEAKDGTRYAGMWSRIGALFFDVVILSLAVAAVLAGIVWFRLLPEETLIAYGPWVVLAVVCLYIVVFESLPEQGTIGEDIAGIVVADLNGNHLSLPRSLLRLLLRPLSLLTVIGYPMMIFSRRKQTLHDRIAGTLVLRYQPSRFWLAMLLFVILSGASVFYLQRTWYPDLSWRTALDSAKVGDFSFLALPEPPARPSPVPVPATPVVTSSASSVAPTHAAPVSSSASSVRGVGRKKSSSSMSSVKGKASSDRAAKKSGV